MHNNLDLARDGRPRCAVTCRKAKHARFTLAKRKERLNCVIAYRFVQ